METRDLSRLVGRHRIVKFNFSTWINITQHSTSQHSGLFWSSAGLYQRLLQQSFLHPDICGPAAGEARSVCVSPHPPSILQVAGILLSFSLCRKLDRRELSDDISWQRIKQRRAQRLTESSSEQIWDFKQKLVFRIFLHLIWMAFFAVAI